MLCCHSSNSVFSNGQVFIFYTNILSKLKPRFWSLFVFGALRNFKHFKMPKLIFSFFVVLGKNSSKKKLWDILSPGQCDQIWQNFATLAIFWKYSAICLRVYLLFVKVLNLLWQYCANFQSSKWPNIEQIITQSGLTV